MTRIKFSDNGESPFEKLIGHNAQILRNWNDLETTFWTTTSLDKNLLEQVRRAMAFENGCEYCMVKAGKPDFDQSQMVISIAIGFAELFCKGHQSISQSHFEMLKEFFSDAEISELCTFISFINASQKLGNIFNLTEDYQENAIVQVKDIT